MTPAILYQMYSGLQSTAQSLLVYPYFENSKQSLAPPAGVEGFSSHAGAEHRRRCVQVQLLGRERRRNSRPSSLISKCKQIEGFTSLLSDLEEPTVNSLNP